MHIFWAIGPYHCFDPASRSQRVSDHGLDGRNLHLVCVLSEYRLDCFGLNLVVQLRARTMGVNVAHVLRETRKRYSSVD